MTEPKFIENYQGIRFESKGIDLNDFNKEQLIERFTPNLQITGINVALLIYKGPLKRMIGNIHIPDEAVITDKEYSATIGLVIQIGPDAYKGEQFPTGPYCKVGDWVMFPRGASFQFKYEHEPLLIVEDFKLKMTVDDPSKISR